MDAPNGSEWYRLEVAHGSEAAAAAVAACFERSYCPVRDPSLLAALGIKELN